MSFTAYNFIGAKNSAKGGQTFNAINPKNGEILDPTFYEATIEEVHLAVQEAVSAFQVFKKRSDQDRAKLLDAIATQIEQDAKQIIEIAMLETALPEGRLKGECNRTVNQLRLFANFLKDGSWVHAKIDGNIRQMQIPIGPVGVFGASNFPLAFSVAGGDTSSALAAGCPVIVKAHPAHPGTSHFVAHAIRQAILDHGFHPGIFSMVHGHTHEVGMAIVKHSEIRAIGFTGSFRGGKAIFDAANQRPVPIPVFAEMGSTNPVFILPNALKEQKTEIAEGLVKSINLGVGQFCTNPGLVLGLENQDLEDFIRHTIKLTQENQGGTMLTKNIKEAYTKNLEDHLNNPEVQTIATGNTPNTFAGASANILKTSAKTFNQNAKLEEEIFGPASLFISAESKEEMIQIARSLSGHLTATIHGTPEDLTEYIELIDVLKEKVGRLILNGYPTGVAVCHAMVHGGPFPATTNSRTTSVGSTAIYRFTRPICFQDFPDHLLPPALQDDNPLRITRLIDGAYQK